MVLTVVILVLVGGFVLLYPLSRRLGALLERQWLSEKGTASLQPEVARLREAVESLEAEVERLAEKQEFTDRLLDSGRPASAAEDPTA